jgi:hypothetical protein
MSGLNVNTLRCKKGSIGCEDGKTLDSINVGDVINLDWDDWGCVHNLRLMVSSMSNTCSYWHNFDGRVFRGRSTGNDPTLWKLAINTLAIAGKVVVNIYSKDDEDDEYWSTITSLVIG